MVAQHFPGLVLITVIQHRTIVAGQYDERILRQSQPVHLLQKLRHTPVGLQNHIAARTHARLACKTLVGHTRHVGLVQTIIQKERSVTMVTHKLHRFLQEQFSHFLILPLCLFPAFLKAYPGHSVHNGACMPGTGVHTQQFGIVLTCRLAGKVVTVVHVKRIVFLQSHAFSVLYEYARHAVIGGSLNERVVVTHFFGARLYRAVPVHLSVAQSQVPFAHSAGGITGLFHYLGQGYAPRVYNEWRVTGQYACLTVCPGIHSRNQRIAAGS